MHLGIKNKGVYFVLQSVFVIFAVSLYTKTICFSWQDVFSAFSALWAITNT